MDHQTLLNKAAQCFGACDSQLMPLQGGHWAQVYEWVEADRQCVLKIAPSERGTDLQATRGTQDFLAWLAAHRVPVARPVASRHGNLVELVEHDGSLYLVSASLKISGSRAETLLVREWNPALIQRLGQVMGRMHRTSQAYTPSDPALTRPTWDESSNCFNPEDNLEALGTDILAKRIVVVKELESLPRNRDSWGLSHLDLHFANFVVTPQTNGITLIDFDDCAYGWFAMDIAMVLFDLAVLCRGEKGAGWSARFLENLLAGYRTEKPLGEFWVAQLPALLKLLEIGVYAMLVRDYDPAACVDGWVKTFMRDRERRIREGVPYLA